MAEERYSSMRISNERINRFPPMPEKLLRRRDELHVLQHTFTSAIAFYFIDVLLFGSNLNIAKKIFN